MNELPKRKRNRLTDYDYSQNGVYHITICTANHRKILSEVIPVGAIINRPQIKLSATGRIADSAIREIPVHYQSVSIEKYVIMPNHVHLLISINQAAENDNGRLIIAPTVSRIIKQFKSEVTKKAGFSLWQKGFYDHIIRNDADYESVWIYIDENPLKWENDEYY